MQITALLNTDESIDTGIELELIRLQEDCDGIKRTNDDNLDILRQLIDVLFDTLASTRAVRRIEVLELEKAEAPISRFESATSSAVPLQPTQPGYKRSLGEFQAFIRRAWAEGCRYSTDGESGVYHFIPFDLLKNHFLENDNLANIIQELYQHSGLHTTLNIARVRDE